MNYRVIVAFSLLLLIILTVTPVWAYEVPDCVDVGTFTVCFLGVQSHGDGTFTWTYSATSDGAQNTSALSNWSLELCATSDVVPGDGDAYTTFTPFGDVEGRPDVVYTVAVGLNPATNIIGIKYEDASNPYGADNLGEGGAVETDIFQFTAPPNRVVDNVEVTVKAGDTISTALITGPACESTALEMVSYAVDGTWETNLGVYALFILVPTAILAYSRLR